jgi:hypothetical protein
VKLGEERRLRSETPRRRKGPTCDVAGHPRTPHR